jgi:hypothetical protein
MHILRHEEGNVKAAYRMAQALFKLSEGTDPEKIKDAF